MALISPKTAGIILLAGLAIILALNFSFIQSPLTILALIFLLIVSIIFLYNPAWGLIAFLATRPALDQFSDKINIEIWENVSLNAAAILGLAFSVLAVSTIIYYRKNLSRSAVVFFWLAYILILFLSLIFSIEKMATLYEIIRVVSIFCVFLLSYIIFQKEKNVKLLLGAVLVSAIVPVTLAIYQLLTGSGLGGTSGIESRLFGTFTHPNSFASFILIILITSAIWLYKNWQNEEKKWLFLGIFLLVLFVIFETWSRGAWLAILGMAFIVGILKSPKIIWITLALFLAAVIFSETARDRMQDVYNPPATSSVRWRVEQWNRMLVLVEKKPWTGHGAGTETIAFENEYGFYAGNAYTHNDLLRAALETGILGFLAFFLLQIGVVGKLFKTFTRQRQMIILLILVLFVGEFIFSLSSNIFRSTATQWILWALVGMALCFDKTEQKQTSLQE